MKKTFWVLLCILLIAACKDDAVNTSPRDTSVPALTYPFVSTASVTKFTAFGGTLSNATTSKGYNLHLTDTGQTVVSASKGIITDINALNEGTITVIYKPRSVYSFVYSGVRYTSLHINDTIAAGSILGKIASTGDISFTVIKNDDVLCPETYGSSGFNTAIQNAISRHNQYNATDSVNTACLVSSLPK